MIDEAIDGVVETFEYIISGEFIGDFWENVTGVFENIGEFSIYGIAFAILGTGFIFLVRDYMLNSFLQTMNPLEAIFWGGATYIGTFIACYLMGKHFEDTG